MSTTIDQSTLPPVPKCSMLYAIKEAYYGFRPNLPKFTEKDYPDLSDKLAIVTGMNTGIGYEVCKLLLAKNCTVIGVVRTQSKGDLAAENLIKETQVSKEKLQIIAGCDFTKFETVKQTGLSLQNKLEGKTINLIIHNAGLMSSRNDLSNEDGIEAMFATNVMGPQLLQHFLDPLFLKKDSSLKRIVWVSSLAHFGSPSNYGVNWDDPTYKDVSSRAHSSVLYGQSKAINIYQAKIWADLNHADKYGIISASCFPGILKTDLTRDYSFVIKGIANRLFWDSKYGAYSELYAALSPDLSKQGEYVVPFGEVHEPREDIKLGLSNGVGLKIWEYVEEQIKQYF
ncbi:uncharacterized protein SCDLUD_001064 [Saccharomycodes ludwigii]|uniref:uncharacterized protein n=1 Tax=Saccharomycodes ludwigii TaxID=36035 RepID=UPI001E8455E0|nr:hypothetical protein SCDLUD_001064 [Saccharomycodes ludwigii]KAH3903426.1 hypothetical protein SCDLUD_001064 [Saccharomycodes ludwigii]